jgi:hypothetical protein
MTSLFDKLNLRPQERRLVVIVGIVVFIVLNLWLVIPMFGEYGKTENRIDATRQQLKKFNDEIQKRPAYDKELKELEGSGNYVATEEAGLRLSTEVSSMAVLTGVTIPTMNPQTRQSSTGRTNAFFEEATVGINIIAGEKELLDFLFRLADKDSLIRVRSMQISPDPSRMKLQGNISLVKSFQRRPPPKLAAAHPKRSVCGKEQHCGGDARSDQCGTAQTCNHSAADGSVRGQRH